MTAGKEPSPAPPVSPRKEKAIPKRKRQGRRKLGPRAEDLKTIRLPVDPSSSANITLDTDPASLKHFAVADLRVFARQNGLQSTGRKGDLVIRVTDYLRSLVPDTAAVSSEDDEQVASSPDEGSDTSSTVSQALDDDEDAGND